MRIQPVQPVYHAKNPPQRRAFVAVMKGKQAVIDKDDKPSPEMSPVEAWILVAKLNSTL